MTNVSISRTMSITLCLHTITPFNQHDDANERVCVVVLQRHPNSFHRKRPVCYRGHRVWGRRKLGAPHAFMMSTHPALIQAGQHWWWRRLGKLVFKYYYLQ